MSAPVPGRIPWRDVLAWATAHDEDLEMLDHLVRALDDEYLAWASARSAAR